MRRAAFAALLSALWVAGCTDKTPSAVVLQVSSEPHVPGDIDELEIEVLRGGAQVFDAPYDLRSQTRLPGTITFYSDEVSSPATYVVKARRASRGDHVIVRKATLPFVEGKTKLLRLRLEYACIGVSCDDPDSTCIHGQCAPATLDPATLPDVDADSVAVKTPGARGCFPEETCLGSGDTVEVSGCSFPAPGPTFAVGLRWKGFEGEVASLVDGEGYTVVAGSVTLNKALCEAVGASKASVVVSTACAGRKADQDVCAHASAEPTGQAGAAGQGGAAGQAGSAGQAGAAGMGGAGGSGGNQGGQAGSSGQVGAAGSSGNQGGQAGSSGTAGAAGVAGSAGAAGAAGASGSVGTGGAGGGSGSGGASGTGGAGGAAGTSGASGAAGQGGAAGAASDCPPGEVCLGQTGVSVLSLGMIASGALVDLDRDGNLDALINPSASTDVHVFLGGNDGVLVEAAPVSGMNTPGGFAVGDVNLDGYPDIVRTFPASGVGEITLNDGTGKFGQNVVLVPVGTQPSHVVVGDANGDHYPDVVVEELNDGASVLFDYFVSPGLMSTAPLSFGPGIGAKPLLAMAMGDVDGDGRPDLVTVDSGHELRLWPSTSFTDSMATGIKVYDDAGAATAVVVADLDGDHKADVAVLDGGVGVVRLFTGDVAGGVSTVTTPPVPALPAMRADMIAADIDGDGDVDLLVSGEGTTDVSILRNEGKVGFTLQPASSFNAPGRILLAGDVDRDGRQDVLLLGDQAAILHNLTPSCTDGVVDGDETGKDCGGKCPRCPSGSPCGQNTDCLSGACVGGTCASSTLKLTELAPVDISNGAFAVGDLSASGHPSDVLVASASGLALLGQPDGSLVSKSAGFPLPAASLDVALGDLDRDGLTDAVAVTGMGIHVTKGTGPGVFSGAGLIGEGGVAADHVAIADLDGDGWPDVLAQQSTLTFFRNRGQGQFDPLSFGTGTYAARRFMTGHVDADRLPDLVALGTNSTDDAVVLGAGLIVSGPTVLVNWGGPIADSLIVDLDGDGFSDFVGVAPGGQVLLGKNKGGAISPTPWGDCKAAARSLAVADFDLDGLPDVVVGGDAGGGWFLKGTAGSLAAPVAMNISIQQDFLRVADTNADGRPDLIAVSKGAKAVPIVNESAP